MGRYNGVYFKFETHRALKFYQCALSNKIIQKGDYYVTLKIQNGVIANSRYGCYVPTTDYKLSREVFGVYENIEDLLDNFKEFESIDNRIAELKRENKRLKAELGELTALLVEVIYG